MSAVLLQGQAVIAYENQPSQGLSVGDYLLIPAHSRNRVAWTADDVDTVWLAVHFSAENG